MAPISSRVSLVRSRAAATLADRMVRLCIWEQILAMWGFSHTTLSLACLSVKPRSRNRSPTSTLASLCTSEPLGRPAWAFMATRPTPAVGAVAPPFHHFGVPHPPKIIVCHPPIDPVKLGRAQEAVLHVGMGGEA